MKLAYLCSQYPAVSHTFILREVQALRELGAEIDTFTIRRAGADHLLADADRAAFQSTFAILPPRWRRLGAAHLRLLSGAPGGYLATLLRALRLPAAGPRDRLWQLFYFAEAALLADECRRRGIRHIHAHLANVAADVALLAAELGARLEPGKRWSWSFTMHGPTELFDVQRHRLPEKVAGARFVVCISDFARSQLMAFSEPSHWQKLHVVHCGISAEEFDADAAAEPLPSGEPPSDKLPSVLCLGRLVPEKGQAVLLQAAALLAARGVPLRLTFAGEGPSRAALEEEARRLGIGSHTTFLGAVGQDRIRDLHAAADVFCLPSFAEGVPVVLMEAMAMRVPVVTTRIAGIPELVEDELTGLVVAPGRADLLAAALQRLLGDPALCRRLAAAGREKVLAEFRSERSAEQLHALFRRILDGQPVSAPSPAPVLV